jgi:predicted nicotinamide N-methyase
MRSRSLIIAHRLGLFACLEGRTCDAAELASLLGLDNVLGLTKLLANLEGLGLLQRREGKYELTEIARKGLLPESPGYYGEFIDFFAGQFESKPIPMVLDHLRTGGLLRPATTPLHWQQYMSAMDRMAFLSADRIAEKMELAGDHTLLDLGGGPGLYAIAACQMYEKLRATIYDLPEALQFAQHNVAKAGLEQKITLRPGSVTDFDYGGPYDVIFLSHTVHLFDEPTVQKIFEACRAALSSRGRLVVRELFTDDSRTEPLLGSLIAMHMWNEGDAYSVPQASELLARAGFQSPEHVQFLGKGDPEILGSLMIAGK